MKLYWGGKVSILRSYDLDVFSLKRVLFERIPCHLKTAGVRGFPPPFKPD